MRMIASISRALCETSRGRLRNSDPPAAACAIMEFSCAVHPPAREREEEATSGLVMQQAIFAKARCRT